MTRRLVRWSGAAVAGLALLGVGWWAGKITLATPADDSAEVETVIATVVEESVGQSLPLTVTVERPFVPVATNGLAGTVTSVAGSGRAEVGDVLYAVDTVPVRVVEGTVPFWRDLSAGAEGEDVAQLQRVLAALGHYSGLADGEFGPSTAEAVRSWQDDLGISATGIVALGELVAVPALPAELRLGETVVTGARLGGGETAVYAPTGEIGFFLVVSPDQAGMIPPEASVTVIHDRYEWAAVLRETGVGEQGNVRFTLSAPDGGPVCADQCDSLPADERTSLRADVQLVPELLGPAVPTAAIQTDPGGTAFVVLADGTRRSVTVLGSSGGVAVVEGLSVGEQVVVLGPPSTNVGNVSTEGGRSDGAGN